MPKMQQIKSRANVRERGEVFTADREVKAMCDLVGDDLADIEKRVLEPAAGNGNFLVEILQRRLNAVKKKFRNGNREFRFLVALSNIYAVEIDKENVVEARGRLKKLMLEAASNSAFGYEDAVDTLLETNIICGNFLTKNRKAIPLYEYVPNYDMRTFDITKYTLHEIKRTARNRITGIIPAAIGKCIDELKRRPIPMTKVKSTLKPPATPTLFPTESPDLFSPDKKFKGTMDKLKAMAEQ